MRVEAMRVDGRGEVEQVDVGGLAGRKGVWMRGSAPRPRLGRRVSVSSSDLAPSTPIQQASKTRSSSSKVSRSLSTQYGRSQERALPVGRAAAGGEEVAVGTTGRRRPAPALPLSLDGPSHPAGGN